MKKLIDAELYERQLELLAYRFPTYGDGLVQAERTLREMPEADPCVHGYWQKPNGNLHPVYSCSVCHAWRVVQDIKKEAYCGYCGARMDLPVKEESPWDQT